MQLLNQEDKEQIIKVVEKAIAQSGTLGKHQITIEDCKDKTDTYLLKLKTNGVQSLLGVLAQVNEEIESYFDYTIEDFNLVSVLNDKDYQIMLEIYIQFT